MDKLFFLWIFLFQSYLQAVPSVRVIPDQLYFKTLQSELAKAKSSIHILQFSFAISDDEGNFFKDSDPYKIAEQLVQLKKKNPKLQVQLYIEGERDTAIRNKITAAFLAENGIDVKEGKTHAKGFAIDDQTLLLGSTNLTTQSLRYNNETNLLLHEHPQIVKGFNQYFDLLWKNKERKPGAYPEQPVEGIQLLADGVYKQKLLALIGKAEKTIDFSIYYFHEADIEKALIEAHKRGVKIRGYLNQHKSFGLELVERNKKTMKRLHEAGVKEVYLDLDTFFSHSKYLIVDGNTILLGTGNWNRSDVEEHPQLYLQVENPALSDSLSRHLSHQIAYESARPIPEKPYFRFWIGYKRADLELEKFDEVIRDVFVRSTIKTGECGGLQGYFPVLLAKPQKKSTIPDEIALIPYQDEPTYRAIREGSVGSVYGPLHFDYFDRATSKSAVPVAYAGKVEVGNAYDLSAEKVFWQKGETLFSFSPGTGNEVISGSVQKYLDQLNENRSKLGIDGYVVLVGKDFLVEYFHRQTAWTAGEWKKVAEIKNKAMDKSYASPSHVEVADSTGYEGNGITRPEKFPWSSFEGKKGAGVINSQFNPAVQSKLFLGNSLASFERTSEEQAKLLKEIKEAFIQNKPIPGSCRSQ